LPRQPVAWTTTTNHFLAASSKVSIFKNTTRKGKDQEKKGLPVGLSHLNWPIAISRSETRIGQGFRQAICLAGANLIVVLGAKKAGSNLDAIALGLPGGGRLASE